MSKEEILKVKEAANVIQNMITTLNDQNLVGQTYIVINEKTIRCDMGYVEEFLKALADLEIK